MRAALTLFACAVVAGCTATYPEGRIQCDAPADCPQTWSCIDHRCWSRASADDGGPFLDARDATMIDDTGIDAAMPDVGMDASMGGTDSGPDDAGPTDTGGDAPTCRDLDGDGVYAAPCGDDCDDSSASTLACTGGTTCCAGRCVNLDNDPDHCMACGHACAPNGMATCAAGVCSFIACNSGFANCGTATAPNCRPVGTTTCNCAAQCQLPHTTAANCSGGTCSVGTCEAGWVDVDGMGSTGCETCGDCTQLGWGCGTYSIPECGTLNCGTCTGAQTCNATTRQCV